MRVFKTSDFDDWADDEGLTDEALMSAVKEMEQGLIDANLGGHVYKKRVPIRGRGKRGSLRTLLAFRQDDKAIFMYGFAKNKRANIKDNELKALKLLAKELLGYTDRGLDRAMNAGELIEVEQP